jgi:hypothetical protein
MKAPRVNHQGRLAEGRPALSAKEQMAACLQSIVLRDVDLPIADIKRYTFESTQRERRVGLRGAFALRIPTTTDNSPTDEWTRRVVMTEYIAKGITS